MTQQSLARGGRLSSQPAGRHTSVTIVCACISEDLNTCVSTRKARLFPTYLCCQCLAGTYQSHLGINFLSQ